MEKFISAIAKGIPSIPHVKNTGQYEGEEGNEKWVKDGKPFIWRKFDSVKVNPNNNEFTLYIDNAYGKLALFENSEIIDFGSTFVVSPDQNVLGVSEAYGFKKPKLFVAASILNQI